MAIDATGKIQQIGAQNQKFSQGIDLGECEVEKIIRNRVDFCEE